MKLTTQVVGLPEILRFSFIWSPNGEHIAMAGKNGGVFILSKTGKDQQFLPAWVSEVRSMVWSPNSKSLAIMYVERDSLPASLGKEDFFILRLQIWSVSPLYMEKELYADESGNMLAKLAWSHDGRKLAAGMISSLMIWDTERNDQERKFSWQGNASISQIMWTSNSGLITLGYDEVIRLWDADGLKSSFPYYYGYKASEGVLFSPQKQIIYFLSGEQTLSAYHLTSETFLFSVALSSRYDDLKISADGHYLLGVFDRSKVQVWEAETGKAITRFKPPMKDGRIEATQCHPHQPVIAYGTSQGEISIRSLPGLTPVKTIQTGHSRSIVDLQWSPDGNQLFSQHDDGSFTIWNLEDNPTLVYSSVGIEPNIGLSCAVWHPTLNQITCGWDDGRITLQNDDESIVVKNKDSKPILRLGWYTNGIDLFYYIYH